jgi:uncharacterized protein (TIGR02147 family)
MKNNGLYQQLYLKNELLRRQKSNEKYSLRSFATFLNISSTTLSRVITGQRILSYKNALSVCESLKIKGKSRELFLENTENISNGGLKQFQKEIVLNLEDYSLIVTEWEYITFLELMNTAKFSLNYIKIAKKMNLPVSKVREIFEKLKDLQLIHFCPQKECWVVSDVFLKTSEDVPSDVLKLSHSKSLKLAEEKLYEVEVAMRDFSSIVMGVNLDKIEVVKKIIRKFRKEIAEVVQEGPMSEVYQMNIQLFPLTKLGNNENV